jgi:hypothetical protein
MARIRSVHPGFFTDEELVGTSMAARLLIIGLWIEADDKGVFEWKPITLKMRIFPVDNVDIPEVLAELEIAKAIRSYEIEGRKYGAIRNFRVYQRPKTPNDVHPMPDDFRNWVGLTRDISPPIPRKGEKTPQMEDGGKGKGEDSEADASAAGAPSALPLIDPTKVMFDSGIALLGTKGIPKEKARPLLGKWRSQHGTESVIAALGAAQREGAIDPVPFIEKCLRNGGGNGSGSGRPGGGSSRDIDAAARDLGFS